MVDAGSTRVCSVVEVGTPVAGLMGMAKTPAEPETASMSQESVASTCMACAGSDEMAAAELPRMSLPVEAME